jgi:hypothetical protein
MGTISNRQTLAEVFAAIKEDQGIDAVYSHYKNGHALPYLAYIGTGQTQLRADGTAYWAANTYQVELYYSKKDETLEAAIEAAFLAGGWGYSKSEDAYLEDEGVFLIFYQLS